MSFLWGTKKEKDLNQHSPIYTVTLFVESLSLSSDYQNSEIRFVISSQSLKPVAEFTSSSIPVNFIQEDKNFSFSFDTFWYPKLTIKILKSFSDQKIASWKIDYINEKYGIVKFSKELSTSFLTKAKKEAKIKYSKICICNKSLHEAIENSDLKTVKYILEDPATVLFQGQNQKGWNLLHFACYNLVAEVNVEILKEILKFSYVFPAFSLKTVTGVTPLHLLSFSKCSFENLREIFEIIKQFKDIDWNAQNCRGETPLMLAVTSLNLNLVTLLLELGNKIDISKVSETGQNVFHLIGQAAPDCSPQNTNEQSCKLVKLWKALISHSPKTKIYENEDQKNEISPIDLIKCSNFICQNLKIFIERNAYKPNLKTRKLGISSWNTAFTEIHDKKIVINEEDLKWENRLAHGAFGEVWKGTYQNQTVAIKMPILSSQEDLHKQEIEVFLKEIIVNSAVSHAHLVDFLGICMSSNLHLIMEYCYYGSLYNVLIEKKIENISWYHFFLWGSQMLKAVYALHQMGLIHRDIKTKNIMITSDLKVKVGDFGLVTSIDQKVNAHGTIPYMAPEFFNNEKPEPSADIYALGIVFWELANFVQKGTYEEPYKKEDQRFILRNVSLKGLRPELHQDLPGNVQEFVKSLWEDIKNLRPSANLALEKLIKIQEDWEYNSNQWEKLRNHSNLIRIDSVAQALDLMYLNSFTKRRKSKEEKSIESKEENEDKK